MRLRKSCSWCHAFNVLTGAETYCGGCGHRADVPCMFCTCDPCLMARGELPARPDKDPLRATYRRALAALARAFVRSEGGA